VADRYTDLPDVEYSTAPDSLAHVMLCLRCQCLVYAHSEARLDHEAWHEGVEQPPPIVTRTDQLTVEQLRADLIRARQDVADLVLAVRGTWPGYNNASEVPGAVKKALQEIQQLRDTAERAPHPYVWRPGDPPPPPMVNVLHDGAETRRGARAYLCRSLSSADAWAWRRIPDQAYDGHGLPWERASQEANGPLVHVPGGEL
jgi:hypothetical protein